MLSIVGTIVVKQVVLAASNLGYLIHIPVPRQAHLGRSYYFAPRAWKNTSSFCAVPSGSRAIRSQSTLAECIERASLVYKWFEVFHLHLLDLLIS